MKIIITGVPGTGKTTISKILAKNLNYNYISINELAFKNKLVYPNGTIKDMKKLENLLNEIIKQMNKVIIEGHLACEMKLNCDKIIIFRCDPSILKKRYLKRNYNNNKIKENIEAECLDYCEIKVNENYDQNKINQINCSNRSVDEIINIIEKIIYNNEKFYEEVDFLEKILDVE